MFSCKKSDKPAIIDPVAQPTFSYTGKMEVSEFKVYKGGPGGGTEVSKDYTPESLWNDRVKNFTPPDHLIFKSKDTLSLLPNKVESDIIRYKLNGDTLLCHNRYADFWEVYGVKSKKCLSYKMTFYIFNRSNTPYTSFALGTEHGITLFKNVFISGRANFESLAQMTNTSDLMGWYNVNFIYESKDDI
ncbi:hypothetical protein TH53_04440 [Pedobacter lusitanus]|uniref:Uncharacterized protein n=2 Tax=Pedobacter lusitanus TaxID=1503925 RepID=A0A0D0GQ28_9SPHI|nr:hypothetical protein TH53_04440 [Pedobacter lusitanus]